MEIEYSQLTEWSTHMKPPTDALSQRGHNIKIVGEPRKVAGSEAKSFMADMFGFTLMRSLRGDQFLENPRRLRVGASKYL